MTKVKKIKTEGDWKFFITQKKGPDIIISTKRCKSPERTNDYKNLELLFDMSDEYRSYGYERI